MRMQEYYESPKFAGQKFSMEEYMDWYAKENGNFTYTSDWNGFNVPGHIVKEFFDLFGDDELLHKERYLRSLINKYADSDKPFYVIGIHQEDSSLEHEMAHAYYYLFPEYKKDMLNQVDNLDSTFRAGMFGWLKGHGYCEAVMSDETQAYLATSDMPYINEMVGTTVFWDCVLEFQKTYQDFKESLTS